MSVCFCVRASLRLYKHTETTATVTAAGDSRSVWSTSSGCLHRQQIQEKGKCGQMVRSDVTCRRRLTESAATVRLSCRRRADELNPEVSSLEELASFVQIFLLEQTNVLLLERPPESAQRLKSRNVSRHVLLKMNSLTSEHVTAARKPGSATSSLIPVSPDASVSGSVSLNEASRDLHRTHNNASF